MSSSPPGLVPAIQEREREPSATISVGRSVTGKGVGGSCFLKQEQEHSSGLTVGVRDKTVLSILSLTRVSERTLK